MKRITAVALLVVASTIGIVHAFAQEEHPVRATLPFSFSVGDKVLPAGNYTILQVRDDLIEVRNQDGSVAVLSTAYPHSDLYLHHAALVFNRYGDQHFLSEVTGGASAVNVNLPASKFEQRARHQEKVALNQSQITIPLSEGN